MAMYCLNLLEIALRLATHDHSYEDLAVKFLEHFSLIAEAMNQSDLWDEDDGFYYDAVHGPDGSVQRVQVRSMVGLIPLVAVAVGDGSRVLDLPEFFDRMSWFLEHRPDYGGHIGRVADGPTMNAAEDGRAAVMASVVSTERLRRLLGRVLDPDEFLSDHGLRSLSKWHAEHPFSMDIDGVTAAVDYEPAESRSRLFGGNSNWRGPVWFPLNVLVLESLLRMHFFLGDGLTVEMPTGSGREATLAEVADDLAERLISLFRRGEDGERPAATTGGLARFEADPDWSELPAFYEYFHGDTGGGLGAAHQTGWTALVADLIVSRPVRRGTPAAAASRVTGVPGAMAPRPGV
jgi:hypothetical protein